VGTFARLAGDEKLVKQTAPDCIEATSYYPRSANTRT